MWPQTSLTRHLWPGVIALGLLLVATPGAASPSVAGHTHFPPYHVVGLHESHALSRYGCGFARGSPKPFLNGTLGEVGYNISLEARTCGKTLGNSSSQATDDLDGGFRLHVANGTTQLIVNYSYSVSVYLHVRAGTCTLLSGASAGFCYAEAFFNTSIYSHAQDGAAYWPGPDPYQYTNGWLTKAYTCGTSGPCSLAQYANVCSPISCTSIPASQVHPYRLVGNGSWTISLPSGARSFGPTLDLDFVIRGYSTAYTLRLGTSYTGAEAAVSLNDATSGNGFWVSSVAEI